MGPVPGFAFGAEKLVGVGAGPEHAGRGVTVPVPQQRSRTRRGAQPRWSKSLRRCRTQSAYGTPLMVQVLDADNEEILTSEPITLKVEINEW